MTAPPSHPLRRTLVAAAKLLLLGAVLAIVAAVSAYVTVRRTVSGRSVIVPEVTGLAGADAARALGKQGLSLETVAERYDPRVEAGRILAQEPAPGSNIKIDRKVKVVISLGEKGAAIPELRGSAARGAQITLQQQGLRVAQLVYAYTDREEENLVVGQDPMPGQPAPKDGRVSLLVSRGRRPIVYVMPDLTGRPQGEAFRFLSRAGLRAAPPRHDPGSQALAGTVVAQHPQSGYPVRGDDLVTLTVAGEDRNRD